MTKKNWAIIIIVIVTIILISGYIFFQNFIKTPFFDAERIAKIKITVEEQNEEAFFQPLYQPPQYPKKNILKNAYFGDLHVHSALSFDSYLFGNRLSLDESYHFAKGEAMKSMSGESMRLSRPLDFIAVTDHAESYGMFEACDDPISSMITLVTCERFNNPNLEFFNELRNFGEQRPIINPLERDEGTSRAELFHKSTWQKTIEAANEHYDPGFFTTFIAYEYSPVLPEFGKHHRNIIFKNTTVPNRTVSAFDAASEIELWKMLSQSCDDECEFLSIPHNANRSWGLAFASQTIDGDSYTIDDWKQRDKFEPLIEMFQVKGNSECSIGFGTTDEECAFEQFFPPCEEDLDFGCISNTSMARSGLKKGLELERELGFNPLDFGMIGSTDTHHSNPGDTEEWDWRGSAGLFEGSAQRRISNRGPFAQRALISNPGGLAVIWSEENTRDSLFNSMQKKEVYATSGTRIELRFFGSFNFSEDILNSDKTIEFAYENGHPMGSTINSETNKIPKFLIMAKEDNLSAPLDKIQIIKGYLSGNESKEQVIDVLCSENRPIDPITKKCKEIDIEVNLTDCSFDDTRGAQTLNALWTDENYKSDENSFYYVRVIQNPTCRWSTYDSLRLGEKPRKDYPATVKEMAWSSPIWIKDN